MNKILHVVVNAEFFSTEALKQNLVKARDNWVAQGRKSDSSFHLFQAAQYAYDVSYWGDKKENSLLKMENSND